MLLELWLMWLMVGIMRFAGAKKLQKHKMHKIELGTAHDRYCWNCG